MHQHDLLILGAGWTSTFLVPLCQARHVSFAATTRDGRKVAGADTIPWAFNPDEATTTASPTNQFSRLPLAAAILITFPLTGTGQSKKIVDGYRAAHGAKADTTAFTQLGSSGIWQIPQRTIWVSRRSPYNTDSPRAIAEDELLRLGGCVLNLAGLWGGERQPKNWVGRVAKSKEDVKGKKSLHMIHGHDVARAILAVLKQWDTAKGQRWMLTDGFVYDWWALMSGWADVKAQQGEEVHDEEPSDQAKWVYELMDEERVWALPRSMEALGRCYFGREFWDHFGLVPLKARI